MIQERQIGFSPEKEEKFLSRLNDGCRRVNLEQELKTQLAEDFGLVEFSLKFRLDEKGKIVDLLSGEEMVELTKRGGVEEEVESITKIEAGLGRGSESVWVHFSPKNEELGYASNCVDFWRREGKKVVWNRVAVKNNLAEMNELRNLLSGEKRVMTEWEILAQPVEVKGVSLGEIFDLLAISEVKNEVTKNQIDRIVENYTESFASELGEELVNNKDFIFRLYSLCYRELEMNNTEMTIRGEVENYMYGSLMGVRTEASFGCSVTTIVGSFGEKVGYYVLANGEVKRGQIPEGFKECKKCGCWYAGEKCPFCP